MASCPIAETPPPGNRLRSRCRERDRARQSDTVEWFASRDESRLRLRVVVSGYVATRVVHALQNRFRRHGMQEHKCALPAFSKLIVVFRTDLGTSFDLHIGQIHLLYRPTMGWPLRIPCYLVKQSSQWRNGLANRHVFLAKHSIAPHSRKYLEPHFLDLMPDGNEPITVKIVSRIGDIDAAEWDNCATQSAPDANPSVGFTLLHALEESQSVRRESGWQAQHLVVEDAAGRIAGAVPMYLKSHSMGEYVFDYGWANAFERAGGNYYPKLQVSVPFTPVTGPRLLVRPNAAGAQATALRLLPE